MDEEILKYAMQGIQTQLGDIKESLKEIKANQAMHVTTCPVKADVAEVKANVEKNANRISALEKWRWLVTGAAAAAGGVFGTVFANIAKWGS